uniref:Uncharacterized protein n=1 Tax=Klebsiella pneumoniae TaxID=573 RepID=A0A455TMD2_KLEPN|nr:hypothetical protein [Klebsiella pneumoniae]
MSQYVIVWCFLVSSYGDHFDVIFIRECRFAVRCGLAVFSAAPPLIHRFCG